MNKKNVIKSFLLIIVCLICLCGCKSEKKEKTSKEEKLYLKDIVTDQKYTLNICDNQEGCPVMATATYTTVKADTNIKEVSDKIQKMNERVLSYYENHKKEALTKETSCNDLTGVYNYKKSLMTMIYSYNDDKLVNFGSKFIEVDYCNNTRTSEGLDIIYFDKTKNKVITQAEFIKLYGVSEEKILEEVNNYATENYNKEYTMDNIQVYYDAGGFFNAFVIDGDISFSIVVEEGKMNIEKDAEMHDSSQEIIANETVKEPTKQNE